MTEAATVDEIRRLDILPWDQHAADFAGADLLLGNGFSMNLTGVFSYQSLFTEFLKLCPLSTAKVLASFNTTNFEAILEDLGTAARVNDLLNVTSDPARQLSHEVREGLIRTIEQSHPRKNAVSWDRLKRIATSLDQFKDIFTLNYDALLYHIIMLSKDRYVRGQANRYNDYYWNRISDRHLQFMNFQDYDDYKHVYYLHGALFLFKTFHEEPYTQVDVKLTSGLSPELLDAIASEIRGGNIPLFVSEGTTEEKQSVIARSAYLSFASSHLRSQRDRLVIYGASLGEQDYHIADAVNRSSEVVAVGLYVGSKSATTLRREIFELKARLARVAEVRFFDSNTLFQ